MTGRRSGRSEEPITVGVGYQLRKGRTFKQGNSQFLRSKGRHLRDVLVGTITFFSFWMIGRKGVRRVKKKCYWDILSKMIGIKIYSLNSSLSNSFLGLVDP